MIQTYGQRLDFIASHRPSGPASSPLGHNYRLWAEVAGPIDATTGLILPRAILDDTLADTFKLFDHHDFTVALPSSASPIEALASTITAQIAQNARPNQLNSLEISDETGRGIRIAPPVPSPEQLATSELASTRSAGHPLPAAEGAGVFPAVEGRGEGELPLSIDTALTHLLSGGFSAAHRAHAPRLSDDENRALFGTSNNPAGHGHNYRVEIESPSPISDSPAPWAALDHLNLSHDVPELSGRNAVTETVAELLASRAPTASRVRVWESPELFAVYETLPALFQLGRRYRFHAAHNLFDSSLSPAANCRRYGRCAQERLHGHAYTAYVVVAGPLNPLTDTVYNLGELDAAAGALLRSFENADLSDALPELEGGPATVEQAALAIWRRLERMLGAALVEFSLYESPDRRAQVKRG